VRLIQRLGVNLLYLVPGQVGGSEVYAQELLSAIHRLEPDLELVVYCAPEAHEHIRGSSWSADATVHVAPGRSGHKPLRGAVEQTWLPARVGGDGVELLHSLGTTAPVFVPVPSVVTVLDLIFHHVRSAFPSLHRTGLEAIVPRAARRADAVIAISEFGASDIETQLGIKSERIFVTRLASRANDTDAITPEDEIRHRFALGTTEVVLCVSAAISHKNLDRLIAAFATVPAEHDAMLVLVGHSQKDRGTLASRAVKAGISDRVRVAGWIPREQLEGLYGTATVFAFPSLIEGFGMPILEAMDRGVPVACSSAPALREVAGDAAEFFNPHDTSAIAAAITRLLADPERRAELTGLGRERAREFSWERCAAETLAVYDQVLAGNVPGAAARAAVWP
jgi:glycosyltransferase involved in cell wall biosynthesis